MFRDSVKSGGDDDCNRRQVPRHDMSSGVSILPVGREIDSVFRLRAWRRTTHQLLQLSVRNRSPKFRRKIPKLHLLRAETFYPIYPLYNFTIRVLSSLETSNLKSPEFQGRDRTLPQELHGALAEHLAHFCLRRLQGRVHLQKVRILFTFKEFFILQEEAVVLHLCQGSHLRGVLQGGAQSAP